MNLTELTAELMYAAPAEAGVAALVRAGALSRLKLLLRKQKRNADCS